MEADDTLARMSIKSLKTRSTAWGEDGAWFQVPVAVAYVLGKTTSRDIADIAKWAAAKTSVLIDVPPTTPHKFVIAALNQLRAAGVEQVTFVLPEPPTEEYRLGPKLPYPGTNVMAEPPR